MHVSVGTMTLKESGVALLKVWRPFGVVDKQ
jgi:hypothetical protein